MCTAQSQQKPTTAVKQERHSDSKEKKLIDSYQKWSLLSQMVVYVGNPP